MSGVLKGETAWRETRSLSVATSTGFGSETAATDPRLELRERIAALEAELAELRSSMAGKFDEAHEQGRLAGLRERDESAVKRLTAIERGLSAALEAWASQLAASHGLAVEIARSVLGQMIANPDWQADFVRQAMAARVNVTDRQLVVGVRVSPADYSDEELASFLPGSRLAVRLDRELGSGQCVFDLQMGQQPIGAQAQWCRVMRLLDELGEAPC